MSILYREMSIEQKARHHEATERYRKTHMKESAKDANKYYHANKEVCAIRAKAYKETNREHVRTKQREDKRKRKLWAIEFLGGMCSSCKGTFHPAVYEFHHRDPETKDRDPSKMLSLSKLRLEEELNKCSLLCANCHRYTHHGDKY